MKVPFFKPWITDSDKKLVIKTLDSRWLTGGPTLEKFEKKFNEFLGTRYSIGVGSATQGLHLSMRSLGISNNDEVIVPTFTFAATANSVIYCGAKPVFADVDNDSFNITPNEIEKKITKKTKAIVVVHFGGQSCDMDKITKIASKHSLAIVEDCAHALGSTYDDKKCGSLGTIGCFSFYPTKIITTGEGGMVTTNDKKLNAKIRLLRSQGLSVQAPQREKMTKWQYDVVDLGYNYRLDEIRSSLGLSQLQRIKKINSMRIKIAKKYTELLDKIPGITTPKIKSKRNHIFHLYTIKIEDNYHMSRDKLFEKLSSKGIGTSIQYFPLHGLSYYSKKYKIKKSNFPISNSLKNKVLSLPIFPQMTEKQIRFVVSQLK